MTITTQEATKNDIYWASLQRLESWLIANDFKAFDPFDGLLSPLRLLTFRTQFLQQVLQQVVRRNPFNLRPLIGIRPHTSTKGMGFLGAGYARLYRLTGDEAYHQSAKDCFDWLIPESGVKIAILGLDRFHSVNLAQDVISQIL